LRRAVRFIGLVLLAVGVLRVSFWHVENDIREAAYRHAFTNLYHNRSTRNASFIGVCYGCSSCDRPSIPVLTTPFLLNRFKGCRPPVRSIFECRYDDSRKQIADKRTGRTGAAFLTGMIRWVSWDTVKIEAGYYEGLLSSSGNIYTLKRKNGRWVVVNDRVRFLS
jgi:hypothetical protein